MQKCSNSPSAQIIKERAIIGTINDCGWQLYLTAGTTWLGALLV